MAHCPKCSATIGMMTTICPSCGYDFPPMKDNETARARGWEYSGFAEFSLIIGAFCSVIVAVITAWFSVIAVVQGSVLNGGLGILQAITMYALFVVFLRVKNS